MAFHFCAPSAQSQEQEPCPPPFLPRSPSLRVDPTRTGEKAPGGQWPSIRERLAQLRLLDTHLWEKQIFRKVARTGKISNLYV